MRLIDSYITQLKVQGPSRTCNESKEEEEDLADLDVKAKVTRRVPREDDECVCHRKGDELREA